MRWHQWLRWGLPLAALLVAGSAAAADRHPDPAVIEIAEVEVRLAGMGFALDRPDLRTARNGGYGKTALTPYSPGLNVWIDVMDLRPGDHLVLSLKGPDGRRDGRARHPVRSRAASVLCLRGRKASVAWMGARPYTGKVQIVRGDQILVEQTNQIALP